MEEKTEQTASLVEPEVIQDSSTPIHSLATIEKILEIKVHPNADKLELAVIKGWQCVVQKGIHKAGELVIYVQIDSIVPEAPWSEFLKDRHYRIRTIKLRKELSQGLVLPLAILPENIQAIYEGMDVTKIIGVTKFEKPIPANLRGKIRGNFPTSLVPKTDEERIQNCSRIIEELQDVPVYISVKMDGTSATYIHNNGETHVCSRNLSLKPPEGEDKPNVYWEMDKKYNIIEKLKAKGNYAIQGEVCGEGVQGNKAGLKGVELLVFNVYNIDERQFLSFNDFLDFCIELGLTTVPILEANYLLNGKKFDEMLKMADGLYPNNTPREGIVIRPLIERTSDSLKGERASFKIVSNEFLLKYGE